MKTTPLKYATYKTQIVELKGGVNENVSSLELKAGELIDCKNYLIAEGGYGGYRSTLGYERTSGQGLPSEYESTVFILTNCSNAVNKDDVVTNGTETATALADGAVIDGTYGGGDATVALQVRDVSAPFTIDDVLTVGATTVGTLSTIENLIGGTDDYHEGIEYFRSLVPVVPGEGPILGVHIYKGKMYAWRKTTSAATVNFCKEDATTGWAVIDSTATWADGMHVHAKNANYSARVSGHSMYWTDTVNEAKEYDGTTITVCDNSTHSGGLKPIYLLPYNDYMILVYEGGTIMYSNVGDPTDWSVAGDATGGKLAGEISGFDGEITNVTIGIKDTIVVNTDKGIKVLNGQGAPSTWIMQTFSDDASAFKHTAQRLLGTIMFVGEQGLTSMEAVQEYGDYAANSLTQKVKSTLNAKKNTITSTTISKFYNQYRIFFEDMTGIVVSFQGREYLGASFLELPDVVDKITFDVDSTFNEFIIFSNGTDDGLVYKMDSGYSFDDTSIICRMSTAFYHYGSPRQWKAFKSATFEIFGENGQSFPIKVEFDYNEPTSIPTIWNMPEIYSVEGTAIWGSSKWGTMKYGIAQAVTNRVPVYLQGVGTNMSYKILSNESYRKPHIIQNVITDFALLGRRT